MTDLVPPAPTNPTDPAALGWMRGHPPPPERQVRAADMGHFTFPKTRWSFAHMRQLLPTTPVWRGSRGPIPLPRAERDDLDDVRFVPLGASAPITWRASLDTNHTDAICVLHRGRIVYERYLGAMAPQRAHIAFSVTKSYVGTLAAMLVDDGLLVDDAPVTRWIPELSGTAWGDATVGQVLDMRIGVAYSEDYTAADSGIARHARAGGVFPRPPGYDGPDGLYGYLKTLAKEGEHGADFAYKTVNTDVAGWLIRRASGMSFGELLSERIWQPLGCEEDGALLVDPEGTEFAGGGLNATLRDLARFGECMRLEGRFGDRQIVPAAVVHDIRFGGSAEAFRANGPPTLPGGAYRRMWWVLNDDHGSFAARGIHGQAIVVDPAAEMVIARFASHPLAANVHLDPASLPAYRALAEHLMR